MSRHRLGFAVKVLGDGGLPSHDSRRWQSGPHLSESLQRLEAILAYCERNDLRMYRMATALAPYASHPELPQFHGQIEECAERLAEVGMRAGVAGVRLSTHPGQYTVLNSEDAGTRANAVAELEVQARLFDAMSLPAEAVVVLHVGGLAGGVAAAADRFRAGLEALSEPARRRLVIENDDRSWGIGAVTELAQAAGLRVVFDPHHHRCRDPAGIPEAEALALALGTWPDAQVPKIHFSSPRLDVELRKRRVGRRVERRIALPQMRAHADLVDPASFEAFMRAHGGGRDFDVMVEAKAKDLAVLRLREDLASAGLATDRGFLSV